MNLSWKILNLLAKLESRRNTIGEPTFNEVNARIKNIINEHTKDTQETLTQINEIMLTINGLSKENSIHEVLSTRALQLLDTFNDKQQ